MMRRHIFHTCILCLYSNYIPIHGKSKTENGKKKKKAKNRKRERRQSRQTRRQNIRGVHHSGDAEKRKRNAERVRQKRRGKEQGVPPPF